MSVQVQFRRGNTAQHATFTGAPAEITVDSDKNVVVVHDGITAGGHPMAGMEVYVSSNAAYTTVNAAYTTANAAYVSSNAAYTTANAAYSLANNHYTLFENSSVSQHPAASGLVTDYGLVSDTNYYDAFGASISTKYDCMEPGGGILSFDQGSSLT